MYISGQQPPIRAARVEAGAWPAEAPAPGQQGGGGVVRRQREVPVVQGGHREADAVEVEAEPLRIEAVRTGTLPLPGAKKKEANPCHQRLAENNNNNNNSNNVNIIIYRSKII